MTFPVLTLFLELCFLGMTPFHSGLESVAAEGSENLTLRAVLLELWTLSVPAPLPIPKGVYDGSYKVLGVLI